MNRYISILFKGKNNEHVLITTKKLSITMSQWSQSLEIDVLLFNLKALETRMIANYTPENFSKYKG